MKTIKYGSFILLLILTACQGDSPQIINTSGPLFKTIPPVQSNIKFTNVITETPQNNMVTNDYIYSGGGVAIGDINNDGLSDIFLISNQQQHGLYLNKGNFEFEDITTRSGIKSEEISSWSGGVVMEDINQDGFMDIYINRGHKIMENPEKRRNQLYINNGNNSFTEQAAAYGLDDPGVSVQTAFFDYDLDGDLDAYVMNLPQVTKGVSRDELRDQRTNPKHWMDSDHFYRNEGNNKFVEVSKEIGTANWGSGLAIAIGDLNKDGYPDIYISNDFETDNFLYMNNQRGGFVENIKRSMRHVSFFAMGTDMADVDNNGHLDIFEVEMMPKDRKRAVVNMQSMDRQKFEDLLEKEMLPQYMRNSLHLNRGQGKFSEIAQFANIAKTDWSWGAILMDLDDDGHRDLFVTNGIARDAKDRDYTMKGNELAKKSGDKLTMDQFLDVATSTRVPNYAFKNNGDTSFEDVSEDWGVKFPGFSNGLAYGDLDNDGDMDIVVHNLIDHPLVYENTSAQRGNNYINFKFKGPKGNLNGVGARVTIYTANGFQYHENYHVRGFQSSSETGIHFGLGKIDQIDSIRATWPSNKEQVIRTSTKVNQTITFDHVKANETYQRPSLKTKYLKGASRANNLNFLHQEIPFDDYQREILIPHKMSQLGPSLATGDVNGDGLSDFYVGGAHNQAGVLFSTTADGKFQAISSPTWEADKKYEDLGACFFDLDNDKDLDLYVVSGSNEFDVNSGMYQDRIYINDGKGNFTRNKAVLPTINASGAHVSAADFDGDGDQDVFLGGRQNPGKYPLPGKSYLFKNDNGVLKDVTSKISNLEAIGMVTDAVWSDYDQDEDLDLLLVGEWMGIKVFNNHKGNFTDVSNEVGLENTNGWWFSLNPCDLDGDGDTDFIAGNIGLNHKFRASKEKPFEIFCSDFDENGNLDIVLAFEQKDKLYPVRGRDCSSEQMPFITEKFPTFASFGDAGMDDIFEKEKLDKAVHNKAELFASMVLINNGGQFEMKELPVPAQYSPITGVVTHDFNKDGKEDLLAVGNMFQTEAETSRADASFGLMLLGDGKGNYEYVSLQESGFYCPGDTKDIKKIILKNGNPLFIVASNDSQLQSYTLK